MKISKIRKYFMFTFSFILFVSLAIVALIIARGNMFTDQGLVSSGSIRLNISPLGEYQAYLNEQVQKVTNNSISTVTPGTYELKIEKPGFTSWHQSIDVRAGLVTDIAVQLFPQDLQLEQMTKTNIDHVFFSPSNRYAYYSIINYPLGTQIGIWKETLQQSNIPLIEEKPLKITNLTNTTEADIAAGNFIIKPSSDDSRILLITPGGIYVLDSTRYNEPEVENMLDLSYPVDEVSWLRSPVNLLVRSGDLLIDYDLDKKSSTIITYEADNLPVYSLSLNSLVYVLDNKLYRYTPGSNTEILLENVTLPANISAIETGLKSDTNLILKAEGKLYYLSTLESYLTELGEYDLITVSPNGRNLIVSDGNTIQSLAINISLAFNSVEAVQRPTELDDLIRGSLVWDPNSNYFVFQKTGETGRIYSADYSGNNVYALLDSSSIPSPAYYGLPENNSGLIVRLFDSQNVTDSAEKRANLYRLEFTQ